MEQSRLKWVDNVKSIAMISVVLCHVVDGLYGANIYPEASEILYTIRNICNIFQMPLFCMASGYLFAKVYIDDDGSIRKGRFNSHVKTLISTYILWCWVMGISKIALNGNVNYEVKPVDLLLIWVKPIGIYWYLYVLIVLYVMFSYRTKIKLNDVWIFNILLVLGIIASLFVNQEGHLYIFRRILYYAFIFYIGILLTKIKTRTLYIVSCLLSIVSVNLTVIFWNSNIEIYHIPIVNLVTAIGYSLIIIVLTQIVSDNLDLNNYIGKNSLDIYLLHVFFAAGGRMVVCKLGNIQPWFSIIFLFFTSLFIPLLIGFLLRKINAYDLIFKPYIFYKKRKRN